MITPRLATLAFISSAYLIGCSAALEDDRPDGENRVTLSGKVADGYLNGAKVCLDIDRNKLCDADEPSTLSGAGGDFTLEDVDQAQVDQHPLLVEIIAGSTVDEDNPNTPIDKKYTLSAPAGYHFVSPLTTMVQNEIETKDIDKDSAMGRVQAKLGTTVDLKTDYVAFGVGGDKEADDGVEFDRLHRVAQVTAAVLKNNIAIMEQVLKQGDPNLLEADFKDIINVITAQITEALTTIKTQVNSAGNNFNPDSLAKSESLKDANIEAGKARESVDKHKARRSAVEANIATLLANNEYINRFDGVDDNGSAIFTHSRLMRAKDGQVNDDVSRYNATSQSWETVASTSSTRQACLLNQQQWPCVDEEDEVTRIEGDTVIIEQGNIPSTRVEIKGRKVDLNGRHMQTFMANPAFDRVIPPSHYFGPGAVGYRLEMVRTDSAYRIDKRNATHVNTCDSDTPDGSVIAGNPFNPTDTWCNNVFVHDGDGNGQNDGQAANTLAQLISDAPSVNPTSASHIKGFRLDRGELSMMVELLRSGEANFYLLDSNSNNNPQQSDVPERLQRIPSHWQQIDIGDITLATFKVPPVLFEMGDFEEHDGEHFLSVVEDYVRLGHIEYPGHQHQPQWVFNNAAASQIKSAFNFALSTDLTACTTADVSFDEQDSTQFPGVSASEFVNIASASSTDTPAGCGASALSSADLTARTLINDFGFLRFDDDERGHLLIRVDEGQRIILPFEWRIDSNGHAVIDARMPAEIPAEHDPNNPLADTLLRLTLAKIEYNDRQISLKTYTQEGPDGTDFTTTKGTLEGVVWGLK